MTILTFAINLIYDAFDAVWSWFLSVFSAFGLDGASVVFAFVFASAVLIFLVRPFIGQSLSGQSDVVTRSVTRDVNTGQTHEYITRTRSDRVRRR